MEIVAVRWTSLQDFPDRVAAVLWTRGCNLRCPFCYNAQLVLPELSSQLSVIPPQSLLEGLEGRKGFLDGVVLTGGEPTLLPELGSLLQEIKLRGLQVKLDTNGTRPEILARLLEKNLLDYVSLDVKAPPGAYERFSRPVVPIDDGVAARVQQALNVLRQGEIDHEVRTTAAPGLGRQDILEIARWIAPVPRYRLQPFVCPTEARLIDESQRGGAALTADQLQEVAADLSSIVPTQVRD